MALDHTNVWDSNILRAVSHITENYGQPGTRARYDKDRSPGPYGTAHISAVYINEDAILLYDEVNDIYCAVELGISYWGGMDYHRSTKGNFKRCKKAFEKYSPSLMKLKT